ncbi:MULTISPECIES: hypothetical protein [Rhizobium]|uniref:hypothetical protein n=1 Tax=Rhizobium TaxID=379 RepID=UPI0007EBDBA0|nr:MULTISPECIES: hypothetical protein [Rhizobium]ANK94946.1 hypothetical protein AMK01_PD00064 [Rhizobium sp. N6212]ANL00998.1 hypothetical protein AMK00_PD00064 [Rhizobium sp. N621]ANL07119.1 hypothetical protein AMJ99_PD00064 [Rhizobium esperanzae]ANL13289.1 hypothetical protein AMJ98_PE00064 [Rhizobium sp. N1341]ANL25270.1 hypothetical protein AMJ96_PD00064 [Rhizobium sp. N113]
MLDSQSIHLKALDSADLQRLQTVLNEICREVDKPMRSPDMQEVAALLIRLYRHGLTDEDKLLSVGRLASAKKALSPTAAVTAGPRSKRPVGHLNLTRTSS